MPEKRTIEKARADLRAGKSPSTAAGEFVREEIEHVREGKHGARSPEQAIAIGLSKARRAGIPLKPPPRKSRAKKTSRRLRPSAKKTKTSSRKRSAASLQRLKREPKSTVSRSALSRHAKRVARRRKQS
jgi:hypothetical protein